MSHRRSWSSYCKYLQVNFALHQAELSDARRDPAAGERHRVRVRHAGLHDRRAHLRHHCRQHRIHDHQHERRQGRDQEQDGRHQAVHELQKGIHINNKI
jgi:hypothetical protein